MRLGYGTVLCGMALCSSSAASQPRAHFPREFLNTTASTTASSTTLYTTSNSTLSVCTPVTTIDRTGSQCISYCSVWTFFSFATNATSTVTAFLTVFGNSTSLPSTQFARPISTLPPQPCEIEIQGCRYCDPVPVPTTVSLVTSKTRTVTKVVTAPPVCFSCGSNPGKVPAISPATPLATSPKPNQFQVLQRPSQSLSPQTNPTRAGVGNPSSSTVTVNGVSVGLPGSSVVIDGTPVIPNGNPTTVTAGGQVFTVNPSQVIGPGTTIDRPILAGVTPMAPASNPTPMVLDGVTVAIGPSFVVVGGTTFAITPKATPTAIMVNGVPISIGPGGVGFPSTTIQPGNNPTSTPVLRISKIAAAGPGSSIAVIGGSTFTFGPEPLTHVIATGGITFTEIIGPRSTIAIFGGQTFAIGTAGPRLISITAPTPANSATQVITAGGITFSDISSSLVIIGSSTFTVDPGATPTTDTVDGQSISIGPDGVGFAGTTVRFSQGGGSASTSTAATGTLSVSPTQNGARGLRYLYCWDLLVMCMLLGVWFLV